MIDPILAVTGALVLAISIPGTWWGIQHGTAAVAVCAWFGIVVGFAAFLMGVVGLTIVSPWS